MQKGVYGELHRRITLCIDSYACGVPVGRIYHPCYPEGIAFQSLTQLLLQTESLLNEMNFPQAFTVGRGFGTHGSGLCLLNEAEQPPGRLATFRLRILFRQNASWQGAMTWSERGRTHNFRSVLELILLMDSALQDHKEEEEECPA